MDDLVIAGFDRERDPVVSKNWILLKNKRF